MIPQRFRYRSHRAVSLMAAVLSLSLQWRLLAGDPPAIRPANVVVNRGGDEFKIQWESDGHKRDAEVIWHTEDIDRIGSMGVGAETIVVAGGNWSQRKAYCLGLSRATGKILWRVTHDHIPQRVHDMASVISSTPFIDKDRVYYVSNRGELCCLKVADGKVVWMLDMPKMLGVFKRDPNDAGQLAPSPIVVGDIVYCITGNGADDGYREPPAPNAPSFLAVDKLTGKVIWSSNAPGKNVRYGQWSTPALATVDGAAEILFPGGDGALYAFESIGGKQLWKIDCRDPLHKDDRMPADFITAPPLVVGQTAYVSVAFDVETSQGPQRLMAIDLHNHEIRWAASPKEFAGTLGPMAFSRGTVYAASTACMVVAIDADSGKTRWTRELDGSVHGGICFHNEKLYLITDEGRLLVLAASTSKTLAECNLEFLGVGTPVVDGNRIFVASSSNAFLIRLPGE